MPERGLHQIAERRHRRAGGDRIGGVGGDQQRRAVAAPHRALEIGRYLDREQHRAGGEQTVELGLAAHDVGDIEILGVLQRLEDRAAEIALLLQQHRGRQMARIGVDGVAEQQELHQRDHDDHRERDAVALELDELLDQHRPGAAQEVAAPEVAGWRLRGAVASGALIGNCPCALPMRSMNTSSSEGSDRVQVRPGRVAIGRDRGLERRLRRGRRHAGWCRTAPPCRCRAARRAPRRAARGPRRSPR